MTPRRPRRAAGSENILPFQVVTGVSPESVLGPLNPHEKMNSPRELFLAGDRSLLRPGIPRVSVVGARKSSEAGIRRAAKLSKLLASRGVVVVSGLAEGIDTAAHRAAIEEGGRTIAVIGTPLDKAYPRQNTDLQAQIANEHLLVSQFPSGYPTTRANFPMRNRTMALIVDASVIVEAGESSGSLSQGWEALRLNRTLFIMRSLIKERPDLEWPEQMQRYGARILSEPEELLNVLPFGDPLELLAL